MLYTVQRLYAVQWSPGGTETSWRPTEKRCQIPTRLPSHPTVVRQCPAKAVVWSTLERSFGVEKVVVRDVRARLSPSCVRSRTGGRTGSGVTERAKLSAIRMKSLIVEGVSKRYWVPKAQKSQRTETRLDRLRSFFSIPLARDLLGAQELWALRDLTFDVDHGTVLGVIGGNGAGKTTLLKVISKVIAPTAGRVAGPRPRRLAARAGRRLRRRGDGAREHLHERGDQRHPEGGRARALRRHHRVRRDSRSSSTRRCSTSRAACTCGWRFQSPSTCSRRFCSPTRSSPSATCRSRSAACRRCASWRARPG